MQSLTTQDVLNRAYSLTSSCLDLLAHKESSDQSVERDDKLTAIIEHLQNDLIIVRDWLDVREKNT